MKLGLSSFAYRWAIGRSYYRPKIPMKIEEFIDQVAAFDIEYAFLCNNFEWITLPKKRLIQIREYARERGISLETGARETDAEAYKQAIRSAEILGSKVLRIVYDLNRSKDPVIDRRELDNLCRCIEKIIPDAQKAGMKIALENGPILNHLEIADIIDRFGKENLGACLDSMNCIYGVYRSEEVFESLASYAIMVHMKDYTIVPDKRGHIIQGTALGQGEADIPKLFDCLRKAEYSGVNYIELYINRTEIEEETMAYERECVSSSVSYARSLNII